VAFDPVNDGPLMEFGVCLVGQQLRGADGQFQLPGGKLRNASVFLQVTGLVPERAKVVRVFEFYI
jgi:hypothetical protein